METTGSGAKQKTYVHELGGNVIAVQQVVFTPPSTYSPQVRWEHADPSGASYAQTGYDANPAYNGSIIGTTNVELDPTERAVKMTSGDTEEEGGHQWGNQDFCVADKYDTPENCTVRPPKPAKRKGFIQPDEQDRRNYDRSHVSPVGYVPHVPVAPVCLEE